MVEDTNQSKGENNGKAEEKLENEAVPGAPKIFTVEILKMIKDLQQQHGLRHGDYQRYRGYCSRRVRRLRKALKLPQGDKRHFKRKDVTVVNLTGKNADERFIHIPLMLAERAWSYAMQLRQEANTEQRKKFHLVGKLRKACTYALQLQALCAADVCDARTKLETEAYVAWMHGTLQFELSLWKAAAESLKKAQVIYENLAQALPEDEQSVYRSKVDELTPSLRYCAYNIGDGTSIDDLLELRAKGLLENLDILVSQTKTQSSESLQTTEWRGRKVTVRQERVRLFLLSVQEIDKNLEKAANDEAKIELLENILMDCKDAIGAVKDDIKADPKSRSAGQSTISSAQYLLAYLSYIRLTRTIQRNLCLVSQAKTNLEDPNQKDKTIEGKRVRPQDLTRLYEIILQNVTELQQIAGLEEDTKYQQEAENLLVSFKAFRCYYIALTLVSYKRWKEAVALYERSMKYAVEALKSKPTLFNLQDELNKLIKTIEGCKFSAHAYSVLEDDNEDSVLTAKTQKSSKPLFERLSAYKEDQQLNTRNPNVFKLTPEMKPIPCKPLFFDLALNFVEFPSLDDKLETPAAKKGAGISGFVKGFLGWGGNK
uniref:Signal recognition particle subunit SRP68 n=1 Tax=Tabanus bromius TaxID=304241 RepID=A0A0K8TT17_TABBR